jgi:putative FmdB family regulatory protein
MPIYEFVCTSCNSKFSELRKMNEAGQATSCPRCGEIAVQIISKPQRPVADTPLFHGTPHSEDPKFKQQWADLQEKDNV